MLLEKQKWINSLKNLKRIENLEKREREGEKEEGRKEGKRKESERKMERKKGKKEGKWVRFGIGFKGEDVWVCESKT